MPKNKMWDNSSLQEDFTWGNIELPGMSDEQLLNTNWNYVDSNRKKSKNSKLEQHRLSQLKEYYSTQKASIKAKEIGAKNAVNPQWRENRQKGFLKISQTAEYRQRRKHVQQNNLSDSSYRKKISLGVKNWLLTEQGSKAKQSAAAKRRISVLDVENNILYENLKEAAAAYNIHGDTFRKHYIKAQPDKFKQLNYKEVLEWQTKNQ